jgi:hypothetical protein
MHVLNILGSSSSQLSVWQSSKTFLSPPKFNVKVKDKVRPRTGHEAQKKSIGTALFFNFGARWAWVVKATPRPFYPRERPGIHCIADWVGPRTGMDGCGKSCPLPSRDSNPLTVLPVGNRYTDYAIAGHKIHHAHVTLLPYSEVQVQPIRNARRAPWATEISMKCADITTQEQGQQENNISPPSTSAVYSPYEQPATELRPQLPCFVAPTSTRFFVISLNSCKK